MLIVMATYPGADPESVDELVASVIEDSGSTLSGVDSVNSYSFENYVACFCNKIFTRLGILYSHVPCCLSIFHYAWDF